MGWLTESGKFRPSYPADNKVLRDYFMGKGIALTEKDVDEFWEWRSDQWSAGWLSVGEAGTNDELLWFSKWPRDDEHTRHVRMMPIHAGVAPSKRMTGLTDREFAEAIRPRTLEEIAEAERQHELDEAAERVCPCCGEEHD